VGHLERLPPERVSDRCQIGQETSAGAYSGDGLAPKAAVTDNPVTVEMRPTDLSAETGAPPFTNAVTGR